MRETTEYTLNLSERLLLLGAALWYEGGATRQRPKHMSKLEPRDGIAQIVRVADGQGRGDRTGRHGTRVKEHSEQVALGGHHDGGEVNHNVQVKR